MVTLSTRRNKSMEAGVKYFFLGALGAAIFLYGFAFIYGGTGVTGFREIQASIAQQVKAGGINEITMLGIILAIVGISFKIAAVPMHFYTPDVYQGASAPIAGFLAFVPKAAGFFAIMLIVSCVGWNFGESQSALPPMLHDVLWAIAVLTMTVGNVLAILQSSVSASSRIRASPTPATCWSASSPVLASAGAATTSPATASRPCSFTCSVTAS